MKYVLFTSLIWFFSISAVADCSSGSLSVFPKGKTIKQNSIFIIDGYGSSQKLVLDFNKKNAVYLKSGNEKVRLLVKEICIGQFQLTQAVLTLEKPLQVGLEYELIIEDLSKSGNLYRYNEETERNEIVKYRVVNGFDNEKPILLSTPKEIDKAYTRFGCGPAMYVIFDYPVKDSSEVMIKTTVKNLTSKVETTYYIKTRNENMYVGHGMCSGAFKYQGGSDYEVEFSFIDSSGNITSWQGERIKFTEPTSELFDSWEKEK